MPGYQTRSMVGMYRPYGGSGLDDQCLAPYGLLGAVFLRETAVVAPEPEDVVATLPLAEHELTELHLACRTHIHQPRLLDIWPT